ncbi:MAG: phosphoserine phosphatase SerB [Nitrospina sp.]|jgi:phosphoserine phosphatase|nr:phosphoserine phosphatase SerB [Nitrospina sp.]MBT5632231.1 phosphoserine phosphatase SerB [Nitrospina sp.]
MPFSSSSQLHIHISAQDRPGILAETLAFIVKTGWNVVDIKQFVFNGLLNLSILLDGCEDINIPPLREALSDYAEEMNFNATIYPWETATRPDAPYAHRSVVTLLCDSIPSSGFLEITRIFAELDINILRIEQLDSGDVHALEFVIGTREAHSSEEVLNALVKFKEKYGVDIAVQEETYFRRNKRLIVLDADMTFLQCEVIDELGKLAGVGEKMEAITRQAMNGEMDFKSALLKRVKLLKGLGVENLHQLSNSLPLTPGAETLVNILKYLGYKIALVSGGFQFFIDKICDSYGLDYGFANQLVIENGQVSGELEGQIIDAEAKENTLVSLAEKEGFSLRQVVAVGDGANDIKMLARAGLGIAFNAKPIVQRQALASINQSDLKLILYFLGINGKDLQELDEVVRGGRIQSWPSK